jgi:hypothetical protein
LLSVVQMSWARMGSASSSPPTRWRGGGSVTRKSGMRRSSAVRATCICACEVDADAIADAEVKAAVLTHAGLVEPEFIGCILLVGRPESRVASALPPIA